MLRGHCHTVHLPFKNTTGIYEKVQLPISFGNRYDRSIVVNIAPPRRPFLLFFNEILDRAPLRRAGCLRRLAILSSTEMLYYALGALAIALIIVLQKRMGGLAVEEEDQEWDARAEDLSATLRDRFARF